MADNVQLSAGAADGAVIATDDITSVHYQILKLAHGALNAATLVSTASGLPVQQQGTWTEANSAAILAAAEAIQAAVEVLDNIVSGSEAQVDVLTIAAGDNNIGNVDIASIAAGDNNIGNVDVASSVLPTGAATSANQTTIIGHLDGVETTLTTIDGRVDGIEGLLTTIDADTGNIDTKLGTLDNIVPSINGPLGFTAVDSYTQVAINLAAAANQSLVAAPGASKQIWVYGVTFVVNAAGTVSFQDEDDAAISGVMPFAANSGLSIPPSGNFAMPLWKLATNKALEVDVVTSEIDGFLQYAVVSV